MQVEDLRGSEACFGMKEKFEELDRTRYMPVLSSVFLDEVITEMRLFLACHCGYGPESADLRRQAGRLAGAMSSAANKLESVYGFVGE